MSDDSTGSRLPPPVFPPGSRRHVNGKKNAAVESSGMDDAFISPDEPIPERDHSVEDAFISPDDPMPDRKDPFDDAIIMPDDIVGGLGSEDTSHPDPDIRGAEGLPQFETEGGVVTGMGMDDHMDADELASGGDPFVMDLVQKVGKLAEALKSRGEAGLRSSPGMDRFELTLRGYCVGYLAGRRVEDDSGSEF